MVKQLSGFMEHPSDDTLEEYAFGRLDPAAVDTIDEHLLFCEDCRKRLVAAEEFILLMKSGAQGLASRSPRRMPGFAAGIWVAAAAIGAVMLAALVVPRVRPAPEGSAAQVELLAFRGGEEMARAAAGRKLRLVIDLADLSAPSKNYLVKIVDAVGRDEWSGPGSAPGAKLAIAVDKPLRRGVHWVRVLSESGELLREFGLRVE
jgi:hypothetical protein